jgi:hypothetical protein
LTGWEAGHHAGHAARHSRIRLWKTLHFAQQNGHVMAARATRLKAPIEMADNPDKNEAHKAIFNLARELEQRGVKRGSIVDALLTIGVNAGVRLVGKDKTAKFLEDAAAELRRSGTVGTMH